MKGLNSFPTTPLSPHTRIATALLIQKVATERVTRQELETHEVLAESHERVLEEGLAEKS